MFLRKPIRQYVYSNLLANALGKKPLVIPLINQVHIDTLRPFYKKALDSPLRDKGVFRDFITWQDFLTAISRSNLKCRAKLEKQMRQAFDASKKYGQNELS